VRDGMRDDLSREIAAVRADLRGEIAAVRDGMRDDLSRETAAVRADLRGEIAATREGMRGDLAAESAVLRGEITTVRDEMYALHAISMGRSDRLERKLERSLAESEGETRRFMKVLYEDLVSRITLLGEGRT